jgi:two-component system sensor histidine kinase ChvG
MARAADHRIGRWLRSTLVKLAAAGLIFAVVPVLVYSVLAGAEARQNALLLRLVQDRGRLASVALAPLFDRFSPENAERLTDRVKDLAGASLSLKVLFRPAGAPADGFLLVASAPESDAPAARAAMGRLVQSGVLAPLGKSCDGDLPLALRMAPSSGGGEGDLLTYLAPRATAAGCWVVLTAQPAGTLPGAGIGRPYWQASAVRAAAAIYVLMAILILSLFTDIWRNLRRFRDVARAVVEGRGPASFARDNRMPELGEVAEDFDRMVVSLRRTEDVLRQAAEDNAHALKGPLAVIAQSLEPLGRAVDADNGRARRSLELIAQSVERLDELVSAARRIDEAIAGLIEAPRLRVDLSDLLVRLGRGYARLADERSLGLDLAVAPGIAVEGSEEMLETIVENLIDNALDFAPAGSRIQLGLAPEADGAVLAVADRGPGVGEGDLERIFTRHLSRRPAEAGDDRPHYGLGLWIVRRNAEAMGGRAWAEARPGGGLAVRVRLPRAGHGAE